MRKWVFNSNNKTTFLFHLQDCILTRPESLSGWIKYARFGLKTLASYRNASKFTPLSLTSVANFQSFHGGPLRMCKRKRGRERAICHLCKHYSQLLVAGLLGLHHLKRILLLPMLLLTTAGCFLGKLLEENDNVCCQNWHLRNLFSTACVFECLALCFSRDQAPPSGPPSQICEFS